MARHGDITLGWADGEYLFRLAWAQLLALQEACDAGPQHILDRLCGRQWRLQDVEQVLFLGLVGGGMDRAEARRLMRAHVHDQPLAENLLVAQAVLAAALLGPGDEALDDLPGKPAAGETTRPFPAES